MRKLVLLLIQICAFHLAYNQAATTLSQEADEMPYFAGCADLQDGTAEKRKCSNENLAVYIADYLEYPDSALRHDIEGTVYIDFIVNEEGRVVQPTVVRNIGGGCGEEALRIVRSMPTWQPARKDGQPVAVHLSLPVQFSLSGADNEAAGAYTITWGGLHDDKVTRSQLLEKVDEEIIVRDEMGNPKDIYELVFAYRKRRRIREAESRGDITKDMYKILRKVRRGGEFAIITTVQEEGRFIEIERVFEITGR